MDKQLKCKSENTKKVKSVKRTAFRNTKMLSVPGRIDGLTSTCHDPALTLNFFQWGGISQQFHVGPYFSVGLHFEYLHPLKFMFTVTNGTHIHLSYICVPVRGYSGGRVQQQKSLRTTVLQQRALYFLLCWSSPSFATQQSFKC